MAEKEDVMKLLKMIKSFFQPKKNTLVEENIKRNILTEPDFIDYDGMGNQGRFPEVSRRK